MIIDARTLRGGLGLTSDIGVVGAGTVGLLVAKCLADAGFSVTVVEAGDRVAVRPDDGGGARSIGKPHDGVTIGRAMGLGGTSVLWAGQLAEFVECDLTRPGHEWPLDYAELQDLYRRTYQLLGIPQPNPPVDYQRALGIVAKPDPRIEQLFTLWLPQPNFAIWLRREVEGGHRIRILVNATAYDIGFDGSRARKLRLRTASGRELSLAAGNFIVAAGTIASAQFFLTTQQRSAVPWRSNCNIGKYFQDHIAAKVADVDVIDERRFRTFFENGVALGHKLQPKLRFTHEERARLSTGVCGIFSFRSSRSEQLGRIKGLVKSLRSGLAYSALRTLPADVFHLGGSFAPLVMRYLRDRRIMAMFDQGIDFGIQAEQWPIPQSRIELVEGPAMANGLMRVGVNWRIEGRELTSIREFVGAADEFLQLQTLARLRYEPSAFWDGDFMHRTTDTFHQCGGLRMSSSAEGGVLTPDCRVWGTDNVFVAGASVLPTSSYANCTLTALALGVRLAEHLRTSG